MAKIKYIPFRGHVLEVKGHQIQLDDIFVGYIIGGLTMVLYIWVFL